MKKEIKYPFLLFLFILTAWGIYRYSFKLPEWTDEFLFKPLIMLCPVLFLVFRLEKNSLVSLGISNNNFLKNVLIGLIAGIFISFEAIMTNKFKNSSIVFNPDNLSGLSMFLVILIPFATGFVEETVFRGYIMNRLLGAFKSEFFANLLSTILFVVVHLPALIFVQHLSSFSMINSLIQLFVLGAFDGFIFARTRTIVAPTISHSLWNLSAVLFR